MTHQGTKILETNRLILRPFTMEDRDAMFHGWASDPEVSKYVTWPTHETPEVTSKILKEWTESYADPASYIWAIVPKETGEPIGSISVVRLEERAEAAEVGYCISRHWWHRGIGTEALGRVIAFLFQEVGVNRIAARHDVNNPHSGGVMKKCGMKYEGTLRQSERIPSGLIDTACYSILAKEYRTE